MLGLGFAAGAAAQPAVGTLARDRTELIADSTEPILEILVVEGARVRSGQPLVRQDGALLEAQLGQAQAALARSQAQLAEVLRGPRAEEIREATARLAGAEAALEFARDTLDRARTLAHADAASAEHVDAARARLAEARALRDQARAVLDALHAGATAEQIEQARSALAEVEAAARVLQVRVDRLVLRATVDGVVDALPFEVGERPAVGVPVVILVADGAPYARVYVPEPLRVHLQPGAAARVRVDGLAEPFAGRVRIVSQDPAFTPYYALNKHDRGRLAYLAKVDLIEPAAESLPSGVPVEVTFDGISRRGLRR